MCGVYLWSGRLIVVISFIPIFLVMYHTEYLLLKLSQNPEICSHVWIYVMANAPGIFCFGLYDLERRYLTQFGLSSIPMKLQIYSFFVCSFMMWFAVFQLDSGYVGCAIATSISNVLLMLAIIWESNKQEKIIVPNNVKWRDPQVTK